MATEQPGNDESTAPDSSAFSLRSSGDLIVGDIRIGDITGRDKIVNHIQHIYQRTLSAAEAAAQARAFERQLLAEGVGAFVERLRTRASEGARAGIPYRGLLEYRLSDAELFFGRDQATRELLQRLNSAPLTVLHAESGAGKSSLLQASIAPQLLAMAQLPVYLRPYNQNPTLTIKRAFVADLRDAAGLAGAPLHEFLRQASAVLGAESRLVIMLDQFEEFFVAVPEEERAAFISDLAGCLDDPGLAVHWVLALRSESFGNLAGFRPHIRNPFANDYRLNRLSPAEAQAVASEPVRRLGISFAPGLVERLLRDLGGSDVAPPQLQLICSALYEELGPGERVITHASYEREGGAGGILREHLERVLGRDLLAAQRSAAHHLLEALVSSDRRRVVRSYIELLSELSAWDVTPTTFQATLNHLVDARLLKVQELDGALVYELAHDYLLDEINLNPELQARKAMQELLEQEVRAYGRFQTLLTPERLALIEPYRSQLRLNGDAERLLNESQAAAARQRAEAEAQQERELRALRRLAQAQQGTKKAEREPFLGFWSLRLMYVGMVEIACSVLVYWLTGTSPVMFFMALVGVNGGLLALSALAYHLLPPRKVTKRQECMPQVAFSPDGLLLVTVDSGAVRVWDMSGARVAQEVNSNARAAVFSPDGTRLLLVTFKDEPRFWSLREGTYTNLELTMPLPAENEAPCPTIAYSVDGQTLITTTIAGYTHIWERSGSLRRTITGSKGGIISPDGKYVLTWEEATARLWTEQGDIVAVLRGHTRDILAVTFSRDGAWIATASADGTARVWNLEGEQVTELRGHKGPVNTVSFRPDGAQLVTGSDDGTARIWERSGLQRAHMNEHDKPVLHVEYNPDGTQILTVCKGCAIGLWSSNGRFQYDLQHRTFAGWPLGLARYSPNGQRIIAIGGASATVWDRAGHELMRLATIPEGVHAGYYGYDKNEQL